MKTGQWRSIGAFPLSTRVSGKRLGILGLGRIGEAIARRGCGFSMDVRYHNRRERPSSPYGYEPSLGDGNLHYNIVQAEGQAAWAFSVTQEGLSRLVHERVRDHAGSISAEQGIGCLRVADLQRYEDPVKLALLRRIKQALDPRGLMNPGKVLSQHDDTEPDRQSLVPRPVT